MHTFTHAHLVYTETHRHVDTYTRLLNYIHMHLSAGRGDGVQPPQLSYVLSLEEVDLSHNRFSGAIPAALANLPNLTSL